MLEGERDLPSRCTNYNDIQMNVYFFLMISDTSYSKDYVIKFVISPTSFNRNHSMV